MLVTLLGIVGAVVRDGQYQNVLSIFVTLFGIVGAVVREVQSLNVRFIFVTGCPAISERIVPYVALVVSFTLTPQPFCDVLVDQELPL